jgi:16S rRNA (cytosine967-C5)-methyltransferase
VRYIWQHIKTIISTYNGGVPLTHFLRNYFKINPKLGSRDRKALSDMAYSYYRVSKALNSDISFEEKIRACLHVTGSNGKHIQTFLPAEEMHAGLANIDIEKIFPFDYALSQGIERKEWLESMLMQPRLFIRVRKQVDKIERIFKENNIDYEFISDNCIALANNTPVDKLLPEDVYVVQDASSQATGNYFEPKPKQQWYDCCAGAGGKSIIVKDKEPGISLTVSDIRNSILHNLKERFKLYRLSLPDAYTIDATDSKQLKELGNKQFDNIICDVPCSGSGTWARTPEQLYYFQPSILERLSPLQLNIARNVSQYLKPGGRLLYITCSVFQQENEQVVEQLIADSTLELVKSELINGISIQADSMFITVIEKKG